MLIRSRGYPGLWVAANWSGCLCRFWGFSWCWVYLDWGSNSLRGFTFIDGNWYRDWRFEKFTCSFLLFLYLFFIKLTFCSFRFSTCVKSILFCWLVIFLIDWNLLLFCATSLKFLLCICVVEIGLWLLICF